MAQMTDRQERERLDEGLRLLRTFFRIKDRERRRDVIAIVEDVAAAAGTGAARLSLVRRSESGPERR
jgi:adenine/guanine phosphoribosyltransferase-like PRPP-binding protein